MHPTVHWFEPSYAHSNPGGRGYGWRVGEGAYDRIGVGYARNRRPDTRIEKRLIAALDDARSVVNVGAGTGSYEPADREVIPVEPSREMIAQRSRTAAPAVVGTAENLPLPDDAADAAMTILSIHHWSDWRSGVGEMQRVSRGRIVILTLEPDYVRRWWLGEYAPEIARDDEARFPATADLLNRLGGGSVENVPVPADCSDLFLAALWARPELILDEDIRRSTSGFARLDDSVEAAAVARLRDDLETGVWNERHGRLRRLPELDVGLRLVVARRGSS